MASETQAPARTITGRVVDHSGRPVIGMEVRVVARSLRAERVVASATTDARRPDN